jgi:hypothetical protein
LCRNWRQVAKSKHGGNVAGCFLLGLNGKCSAKLVPKRQQLLFNIKSLAYIYLYFAMFGRHFCVRVVSGNTGFWDI